MCSHSRSSSRIRFDLTGVHATVCETSKYSWAGGKGEGGLGSGLWAVGGGDGGASPAAPTCPSDPRVTSLPTPRDGVHRSIQRTWNWAGRCELDEDGSGQPLEDTLLDVKVPDFLATCLDTLMRDDETAAGGYWYRDGDGDHNTLPFKLDFFVTAPDGRSIKLVRRITLQHRCTPTTCTTRSPHQYPAPAV